MSEISLFTFFFLLLLLFWTIVIIVRFIWVKLLGKYNLAFINIYDVSF